MSKETIHISDALTRCIGCDALNTKEFFCKEKNMPITYIPDCGEFQCPKHCECCVQEKNGPLPCEIVPEEFSDVFKDVDEDEVIAKMQKALDWSQDGHNLIDMADDIGLSLSERQWVAENLICRVLRNTDITIDKDTYTVITWPEVQELMEEPWFREEAILDVEGKFGDSAYFIPTKYLKS
jgi:hypothetical protein